EMIGELALRCFIDSGRVGKFLGVVVFQSRSDMRVEVLPVLNTVGFQFFVQDVQGLLIGHFVVKFLTHLHTPRIWVVTVSNGLGLSPMPLTNSVFNDPLALLQMLVDVFICVTVLCCISSWYSMVEVVLDCSVIGLLAVTVYQPVGIHLWAKAT